eukprot:gene16332-22249_t
MPRISERKKLLSDINSLLMHLAFDGKEASAEFNELLMIEYCSIVFPHLVTYDRGFIRYYILGWPGSVFDATIYSNSTLFLNPLKFFSLMQYLIADAGYRIAVFHIEVPYLKFLKIWQIIEHVNGVWKGRFCSLKGLRIAINHDEDFTRVNEWILSTIILHNFLKSLNDNWDEDDDEVNGDNNWEQWHNETIDQQSISLRNRVQNILLNWYYSKE